MKIQDVLEICLYADDLAAAETFYRDVMGLEVLSSEAGRHVFLRCGARMLLIFNAEETRKTEDIPAHGTDGVGHICFAAHADELDTWEQHLQSHGVDIEHHATWGNRGKSIYFRDPDGNSLEIATPRIWGIDESDVFRS